MLNYISVLPWLRYMDVTSIKYHYQVQLTKGFKPGKTEINLFKADEKLNNSFLDQASADYCPCFGRPLVLNEVCPIYCCDPAIVGCVECCLPTEPNCNKFVPAELCCAGIDCVECDIMGGILVTPEICNAYRCSRCRNEAPGNVFCEGSCQDCGSGIWIPIADNCNESTVLCGDVPTDYCCSLCTAPATGICAGCYWCVNQVKWIPNWRVCDRFAFSCPNPLNPACNSFGGGNSLTMCYSYSQNDPIYYNPNPTGPSVQLTYTAPGTSFSYGTIATLCEIPDEFQLCVFVTRVWQVGQPATEVQLTYLPSEPAGQGAGFSINLTEAKINLYTPLVQGETLKIRRCSDTSKMFFHFTDGAKLSAKDLNASLHQLLFLIQEKEFASQDVHEHYPLPSIATVWNNNTAYAANAYVNHTVLHVPPASPNETIIYSALQSVSAGENPPNNNTKWKKVAWATNGFVLDGGQDVTGPIVFSLHGINTGDALVWNGNKFVGQPLNIFGSQESGFELNLNNLQAEDTLVYNATSFQWQNQNLLNGFNKTRTTTFEIANLKVNNWPVFTNQTGAFTNGSFDGGTYYTTGMTEPSNNLLAFKREGQWIIPNPPSVIEMVSKLFPANDPKAWIATVNAGIGALSPQASSPILAHINWDLFNPSPSTDVKSVFWSAPQELYNTSGLVGCFTQSSEGAYQKNNGDTKIWGYGLHNITDIASEQSAFFLNSPECRTNTISLETYKADGTLRNADVIGLAIEPYDVYLRNLRDLAFALDSASTTANSAELTRINRSTQIVPKHNFEICSWKDLSGTAGAAVVSGIIFKVAKELVYENQMAAILGADNDGSGSPNCTSRTMGGILHKFKDELPDGLYNKPNQIHWFLAGVSKANQTSTVQIPLNPLNAQLWGNAYGSPSVYRYPVTSETPTYPPEFTNDTDSVQVKAPFLSNLPDVNDKFIGDIAMLVDVNRLFSTASSYLPEPRDIYVYDIVLSTAVSDAITPGTSMLEPPRAHLFLEWGLHDVQKKLNLFTADCMQQLDILKKEDIRLWLAPLFIKNARYHTKLYIEVPRLKYIGYTGFFRRTAVSGGVMSSHTETLSLAYATLFNEAKYTEGLTIPTQLALNDTEDISKIIGLRNESGVKFVRMGIPTNLWLNISLIPTKAKVSLLTQ